MTIRNANRADSGFIVKIMMTAMEDIVYEFIGVKDRAKAMDFLLYFITSENNQYSFQNCIVAQEGADIIGAINLYDGARLVELRRPIAQYIKMQFQKDFNPEDETQPGEIYIDSIGVSPNYQGKGVGTVMLRHVIDHYVFKNHLTLGLLVDEDNPKAKRLYLKLGFSTVANKTLAGKRMEHLQLTFNNKIKLR